MDVLALKRTNLIRLTNLVNRVPLAEVIIEDDGTRRLAFDIPTLLVYAGFTSTDAFITVPLCNSW